jgi:hypothetical protein
MLFTLSLESDGYDLTDSNCRSSDSLPAITTLRFRLVAQSPPNLAVRDESNRAPR